MDLKNNVESLISTLDQQYSAAESIMVRKASLDDVDCFKQLYAEIDANLSKLMCLMKTTGADQSCVDDISKSDSKFDAYPKRSITKCTIFNPETNLSRSNSLSSLTSNLPSSTKNRANAKRQAALAKLKMAELEAKHAKERAKDEAERVQQEAKRKIELAAAKLEAYKVSTRFLDQRYDSYIDLCAKTLDDPATSTPKTHDHQKSNDTLEQSAITDYPKTCQNFVEKSAGVNAPKSESNQFSVTGTSAMSAQLPQTKPINAAAPSNVKVHLSKTSLFNLAGSFNDCGQLSQTRASNATGTFNTLDLNVMPSTQIDGNVSYPVFKDNTSTSNISKNPVPNSRRTEVNTNLRPPPGFPKLVYSGSCDTQKQLRIDNLTSTCANYFNTNSILNAKAEADSVPAQTNSQMRNVTNEVIYNNHCNLTGLPGSCPNPVGYPGPLPNPIGYSGPLPNFVGYPGPLSNPAGFLGLAPESN